ncbi:MAG: signal peptide peptidase SppA [Deltaproteobacteria bacterium]|nr:signal peptide peptidase SppA [Deltaproteobacteria bacterium]
MRFAVCVLLAMATVAHAQGIDRRYAEEPTGGLLLPATPLAGEHDALATTVNPGGLPLLRGPELGLAVDLEDPDIATSAGPGFGAFLATTVGGGLLPRMGFGTAVEWLRPPRARLSPDPGKPFRFTVGYGIAVGRTAGFGIAWHRFSADGALAGVSTFDLGLSARLGNYAALGAALRDVSTADIAGTPVQRRYELELLTRPLATDALEVAIGGRVGETRGDVDGWARVVGRIARGAYVVGAVETDEVHALVDTPTGVSDQGGRDVRATVGLALSFGSMGVAAFGNGVRDDLGKNHALGGTLVVTGSAVATPSVFGHPDHLERVELSGLIGTRQLTQVVVRLRAIAKDSSAKGVVVMFDGVEGGWATLQELRNELTRVRQAGKKVFAYMVSGTGRDYFVATAANKIYIDPAGGLRLVGMAGTTMYFKGAFDQLGVLPQFEKIAEYKSAPEQFTEKGPTPTAAKMHEDMFDSLWKQWVDAVASARHLRPEEVQAIVDAGPYTAGQLAADKRLVDAVAPPEKISELITTEAGAYPIGAPPLERPDRWERPAIAVIYIDGDIVDGDSKAIPIVGTKLVGGQTVVGAINAARSDPRIGAIVLRINSPGGSALASELISREVFQTRGVKPVLCSFSDVAASGGYFAAAGCDQVFAEPMSITGSIDIFYGKFDLSGLLRKLGIAVDTYKRGAHADVESLYRPFTDEERAKLLDLLRYSYGRFVNAVAEGRHLAPGDVDAAGRGHVYTGEQAKGVHLVDTFGGLGDALDEAKRQMHVGADTRIQLVEMPEAPPSVLSAVSKLVGAHEQASLLDLPLVREALRGIPGSALVAPDAPQARLPYDITFE